MNYRWAYFIGTSVLPPITMFVAGFASRRLTYLGGKDTDNPIFLVPMCSQIAFIVVHLVAYYAIGALNGRK